MKDSSLSSLPAIVRESSLPVGEFLSKLSSRKNLSQHTIIAYRTDLAQFFCFLPQHLGLADLTSFHPEQITMLDVRLFMGALIQQGIQPRSIARKLAALKSFFRYMQETGQIKTSVFSTIVTPKYPHRVPGF